MLLEHVIAYNYPNAADRFKVIAETMGLDTRGLSQTEIKARLMSAVIELKRDVGLSQKLAENGVSVSDIPVLSEKAIKDPCILTNPRKSCQRDVEVVYEEAL